MIDFPRTMSQAKALERELSGYQLPLDKQKTENQEISETWSKLVTNGETGNKEPKVVATKSGLDAMVFLNVSEEECLRRATGRKIDPTTNTIYHPEYNPAPEGDAKLQERLTEYNDDAGDHSRL